jgi:hypothetical protein
MWPPRGNVQVTVPPLGAPHTSSARLASMAIPGSLNVTAVSLTVTVSELASPSAPS